jgi:sulfide:quinone oxidoreductase
MQHNQLTPFISTSPQIELDELKLIAKEGFASIINNRPDGESDMQPSSEALANEAKSIGLSYLHIPAIPGDITQQNIEDFRSALEELPKPILAFCGTGTRATTLWALSEAPDHDADLLIKLANDAGYDLTNLRPTLIEENIRGSSAGIANKDGKIDRLGHPAARDVVIVGGGAGGIAVASSLLKREPSLNITIIEPKQSHYYQPGWTMVGGGIFNFEETIRKQEAVTPKKVRWIGSSAAGFAPEDNAVILEDGERILYKTLVIAAGIKLDWDAIPGLKETLGENGVTSNYEPGLASYTWELINNLKEGTAIFTQPNMPFKCAGAPQKAMYLAADHWRRKGIIGQIDTKFNTAANAIFGVKDYVPALTKYIKNYGIDLNVGCNLVAIDGSSKKASFERLQEDGTKVLEDIAFDMIHVCPPQTAPDFIRQSSLVNKAGWVEVDPKTLQHVRYENIYALGDVCSAPNAKTAAAVRTQAPVVAYNIMNSIAHLKARAIYSGYGSCPLTVERGKIVLAEFGYGGKLMPTLPFIDGTNPSRMAWFLKEKMLPWVYWVLMLRGREWLVKYDIELNHKTQLPEQADIAD